MTSGSGLQRWSCSGRRCGGGTQSSLYLVLKLNKYKLGVLAWGLNEEQMKARIEEMQMRVSIVET